MVAVPPIEMSVPVIDRTVIVGICVVVIVTVGVIFYAIAITRRNTERMAAFVKNIGLQLPPAGDTKTANHNDIDYAYQYIAASRNQPAEFRLWHPHQNSGQLIVRTERSSDRFFKRIGIVAEVQTKDRKFDEAYFINTAEPAFARAMFSRVAARDAVKTIMTSGFDRVTLDEDRILATTRQPGVSRARARSIGDTLQALHELARDQPKIPDHLGQDERASWQLRLQVVYITLAMLGIAGFGLFFLDLDRFKPVDASQVIAHCLVFFIPACAATLYLLVMVLRGRSNSHTHLGISSLIALIVLPFFISGLLMFTNAFGDSSPAEVHRAPVISKRISSGKNGSIYRVRVASWRAGRGDEEFVISRALYQRIEPTHTHLDIATRAGKLGYEWVSAPLTLGPESTNEK